LPTNLAAPALRSRGYRSASRTKLEIVVGGEGVNGEGGGGGGGGSFVIETHNGTGAVDIILAVAGGGGGGENLGGGSGRTGPTAGMGGARRRRRRDQRRGGSRRLFRRRRRRFYRRQWCSMANSDQAGPGTVAGIHLTAAPAAASAAAAAWGRRRRSILGGGGGGGYGGGGGGGSGGGGGGGGSYLDTALVTGSETAGVHSGNGLVTLEPVCYVAGTRVLTERGEVAVENLAVGDRVVTASGTHRPVRWLGHRRVDCSRHPEPSAVWPIRIQAGAFAQGCRREICG